MTRHDTHDNSCTIDDGDGGNGGTDAGTKAPGTRVAIACKGCGRLLVAKTTMKLRKCAVCGTRTPVAGAAVSAPAPAGECITFITGSVPCTGLVDDPTAVVKRRSRRPADPEGGE